LKSLVSGEYFAMAQSVKLSAVLCGLWDPRIGSFWDSLYFHFWAAARLSA
jgi:hypothetical protein